jgi:hypothetical protein
MLGGCSFATNYNPAHIQDTEAAPIFKADGKCLIYTDVGDDEYIYRGSPTSLTGGGTNLSMEIGNITKQIAVRVFREFFSEGVDARNVYDQKEIYAAIVMPKVTYLNYEYNSLRNVGFAITPQVNLGLSVRLLDKNGRIYIEKEYESGVVNGDTYVIALESPGEKINKTVHLVLYDLMVQAAQDIVADIRAR